MRLHEIHLHVLWAIEAHPKLTQRQLASNLGVSLSKAHYCIKALIDKGLVKMGNFSHNQHKLDYAYLLTPIGIKSKTALNAHFLEHKAAEYEYLKVELEKPAPSKNGNQGRDADKNKFSLKAFKLLRHERLRNPPLNAMR